METKDKEHPLTLKVMRLTRPSLFPGVSVSCDARDLPADLLNADLRHDLAIPRGLPYTGIGQVLLLPQSFGNIYLGETFSCCVCVHNNSAQTIEQVNIKAVLQISSERVGLLGASDAADEALALHPNTVTSALIQHEVKDVGTHILVCAVSYLSLGGETQSFRKFYKFQVMKPIDIKTRFLNAELSNEVLVEAGVENITSGPICLEKVTLEPSPHYNVVAIDSLYPSLTGSTSSSPSSLPSSVFGNINVLNPHDTRQYLYCLTPKPGTNINRINSNKEVGAASVPPPPNTIGKLDIVWRSNMGDKGRLQTSQFVRSNTAVMLGDVAVRVVSIPASVTLEEPVPLILAIENNSDRSVEFMLEFLAGTGGCEWHDVTSRALPVIPVAATQHLHLKLLPLALGVQNICGVRLRDLSNPSYIMDVSKLGQVCVTAPERVAAPEHGSCDAVNAAAIITSLAALTVA
uniref:Trafficking protein particle complex subunit 13-like n=1 Tax=Hirondellea gigas TaxID=1518452 RepID=A0A2P2I030_9CRUS